MYGANNNTTRNGGSPPTHLPSPSHPLGFLFFKWEQPPERAPKGDWWLNFPEWWHALCHEDWCMRAHREDHAGTMLRWPQEWPHPLVTQQDQAAHFMQWQRVAGGRPIHEYQRGATEREYMVWKRTLDDVVESAWARHHQAAHACQETTAAHARQEAARRQQLLDEQATHARQEAAAAHARQEAARHQQLLDEQRAAGLLYATSLFAQCIAEDHVAGLLSAKCLFDRCVNSDRHLAEFRTQVQKRVAASTIFLWLRRRCLHIRLARQTLRRLQREANLACLRY